jgi:hypothetical protein
MAQLQLVQVRETKDLEKFIATVMPEDVQRTLQYVYLSEIESQVRLGNKPTAAVIDGSRNGALATVKRRAQAFFTNQGRMVEAITEAWHRLISLTRIKTGRARASYALYLNGRAVGGESDIPRIVNMMRQGDTIQIVGPGVEYGRKLYWSPLGKPKKKRKKLGQMQRGNVVAEIFALHKQVMATLRRKYPELAISDAWIAQLDHGEPRGERWPTITFRPKGARLH